MRATHDAHDAHPGAMNLARLLTHTARLHPQQVGLIHGERQWTWSQIDRRVDAMACALRDLGVRRGDRILLQSRNNLQMFESCWVAFRLGCVWVPTNFRLTPPEVAYLGASSGAAVMIAETVFAEHVDAVRAASPALKHVIWIGTPPSFEAGEHRSEPSYEALVERYLDLHLDLHLDMDPRPDQPPIEASVGPDDPLWFFYTSGTTGRPKAAVLTHGQT